MVVDDDTYRDYYPLYRPGLGPQPNPPRQGREALTRRAEPANQSGTRREVATDILTCETSPKRADREAIGSAELGCETGEIRSAGCGDPVLMMQPMESEMHGIYSLEAAGIECWDVFTKTQRYAGLIVRKKDGSFRHYYNSNGTKGSAKKFKSVNEALENLHNRRLKRQHQ